MPKAKLKINPADFKKLQVAAEFNNVKLLPENSKKVGNDLYVTVSTPSNANLFSMGQMFTAVTGTELDAESSKKDSGKKG